MKKNYLWFTLYELLVVVWILSILSTISFISYSWNIKKSRDSNKIVNLESIQKSLNLFTIKSSKLPEYQSLTSIIWSWWLIFKQWQLTKNELSIIRFKKEDNNFENEVYYYSIYKKEKKVYTIVKDYQERYKSLWLKDG